MTIGELEVKKDSLEQCTKEVYWKIPNFATLQTNSEHSSPKWTFLNGDWSLIIVFSENSNSRVRDVVTLWLITDYEKMYKVKLVFGIVKADGSLINIVSTKWSPYSKTKLSIRQFYLRSALIQCKSELLTSEKLTVMCNIRYLDDITKLTDLDTLSESIKELFINEQYCDTILQVKDKEFKAHKIILAARSPVFAAMFKHDTSEKQTGAIMIPDCDPDSFGEFLEYLYSGKLQKMSVRSALHLYKISDKYDIQKLKMFCVSYMEENLKAENVCNVVTLADTYDETILLAEAQKFFTRNIREIFITTEWKNLMQNNVDLANRLLVDMASNVTPIENSCYVETW